MAKKQKQVKRTLSPLQAFFIGGAVVLFWRGGWGLMDLYLFPDHQLKSYGVSIIAGIVILLLFGRDRLDDIA